MVDGRKWTCQPPKRSEGPVRVRIPKLFILLKQYRLMLVDKNAFFENQLQCPG